MLYVVATPIGNLEDISTRALRTLNEVDLILAEDTRVSAHLLQHYAISTRVHAYHAHNAQQTDSSLVAKLLQGTSMALISDAGTPLLSDPGASLVAAARAAQIKVVSIPGPCALVAALSVCDLPSHPFLFEGFAPVKSAARTKHLQSLLYEQRTIVFYEAKHRILGLLRDVASVFGADRKVCIARELTKIHEQLLSGSVADVLSEMENDSNQQKGEFVVLISGADEVIDARALDQAKELFTRLREKVSHREAVDIAVAITGLPKNKLYSLAQAYFDER